MIKAKGKQTSTPEPSSQNPTQHSYVYLRIQPYHSFLPTSLNAPTTNTSNTSESSAPSPDHQQLQFVLHLSDPEHQLVHTSVTQAIPAKWIDILEKNEWVEELMVEALRVGVEVIGQEYVVARMGWLKEATDEVGTKTEVAGEKVQEVEKD